MMTPLNNTNETRPEVRTPYPLCIHVMNGRAGMPKTCTRDFECWHCAFDQWLDEMEQKSALLAKAA